MHDHTTRAGHLAAIAQHPSPAPAFGDLATWAVWNADTLAATAACHLGERVMRTRKPNRRPQVSALALLGLAGYLAARKAARS
jgi:hypothetical protein